MKKSKRKDAKFFCESCGSEVSKNAKVCPFCGKFFASVRCPKCGNTGTTDEFAQGCPKCGYAVHSDLFSKNNYNFPLSSGKKNHKNTFFDIFKSSSSKNEKNEESSAIPLWIYVLCIAILALLLIMIYKFLRK